MLLFYSVFVVEKQGLLTVKLVHVDNLAFCHSFFITCRTSSNCIITDFFCINLDKLRQLCLLCRQIRRLNKFCTFLGLSIVTNEAPLTQLLHTIKTGFGQDGHLLKLHRLYHAIDIFFGVL